MIEHSADLAKALDAPDRTDSSRVKFFDREGQLKAVLPPVDGTVPADRKQAQMRSFEMSFRATPELIPENLKSMLAPGSHMLVERATKIKKEGVHELLCHSGSWEGELISCMIDENGALTLVD